MLKLIFVFLNIILLAFASEGAPSFTYANQGADWEMGECHTNNNQQSPINLSSMEQTEELLKGEVMAMGGTVTSTLVNNGHTIQLNNEGTEKFVTCTLEDHYGVEKDYASVQFHFHSPSEHTVNGEQFDLEVHIVMVNLGEATNGRDLGVLGFLFKEDDTVEDIDFIHTIQGQMDPTAAAPESEGHRMLSAGAAAAGAFQLGFGELFDLLPEENMFWHYEGGLTTPTCNERVNWYVNKNPIGINKAQVEKFANLWVTDNSNYGKHQGNNRVVQDLGARKIYSGVYEVEVEHPEDFGEELLLLVLMIMVLVSWLMVIVIVVYCVQSIGHEGQKVVVADEKKT